MAYALTGPSGGDLPAGLSFNTNTTSRVLSGTPTTAATTTLTYTATDANKGTASATFTVTVAAAVDNITRTTLPAVGRAMADSTVSAIARRIERPGGAVRPVTIGGQSSLAAVLITHGQAMSEDPRDLKEMLADSDFTLPLNAGDGTANSGASATFWGSGEYLDMSGESGALDWGGDLYGVHFGVDAHLREDLLVGVAVSSLTSDLDYKDASASSAGTQEVDMTSVHPYVGWDTGPLNLWATAGYGKGEVEVTGQSSTPGSRDIEMRTVGGGGSGKLVAYGATTLRLKGEAFKTTLEVDGSANIKEIEVDATRLRMVLEVSQSRALAGGGLFESSLESGLRYDGGDGETGGGGEIGGRLRYHNPATRITAEGRVRALIGSGGDYKEWGIQGYFAMQPGADGQGLSFSLSPGYGDSASEVQKIWTQRAGDYADKAGHRGHDYGMRLDARVGYGVALRKRAGMLTPYGEMTFSAIDSYRIGVNWKVGSRFHLDLLGERREPGDASGEYALLLKGVVRF